MTVAVAQPPFNNPTAQSTTAPSLSIVSPLNEYYKQNNNITLNFDILSYNLTRLSNSSANCSFYLANEFGDIEIKRNLSYDAQNAAWYSKYYTDDLGVHTYYIHCVSDRQQNGYLVQAFETTYTGDEKIRDTTLLTIFGVIITVILFYLYMVKNLNLESLNFREKSQLGLAGGIKMLFLMLSFWLILIPLNFGIYLSNSYIGNEALTNTFIILYWAAISINIFISFYMFFFVLKIFINKLQGD